MLIRLLRRSKVRTFLYLFLLIKFSRSKILTSITVGSSWLIVGNNHYIYSWDPPNILFILNILGMVDSRRGYTVPIYMNFHGSLAANNAVIRVSIPGSRLVLDEI